MTVRMRMAKALPGDNEDQVYFMKYEVMFDNELRFFWNTKDKSKTWPTELDARDELDVLVPQWLDNMQKNKMTGPVTFEEE